MSAPSTVSLPLLSGIRIASPCNVGWDTMHGDDRTRRCDQCSLNVHNISAMTAVEAEVFLLKHSKPGPDGKTPRLCGHIRLRADGTILTADCPVGLAAVRARARRAAVRIAAAIGLTAAVSWLAARESPAAPFAQTQPLSTIALWLKGQPSVPAGSLAYDGDIVFPVPAPSAPGGKP